jgi:hypothetical protein
MVSSRSRRFGHLLLFAACAAASAHRPVAQPVPSPVRAQVKVSADDDVRPGIRKCLEDEVRTIPGVQLTDAAPEYTLSVIALKVVNQSQRNVGTTFSVVVTASTAEQVRAFADAHVAAEDREELQRILAGTVKPLAHWVETASASDMPKVCRSISQAFSTEIAAQRAKAPSAEGTAQAAAARAGLNAETTTRQSPARP